MWQYSITLKRVLLPTKDIMAGRPKGTGGKARELTKTEIKRIAKCLGGTLHEGRNRALLFFGLGSGMRVSELCGLTLGDVAYRGQALNQVVLEKHSTKSKKSRTVHISKQAQRAVETYLEQRDDVDVAEAPLFPSSKKVSVALTANGAVIILGRMFERGGVSGVSSHSLRRTHANSLRRAGADLKIIQQQLGHASLSTTERYFDVDPLEVERAVGQLSF